MSEAPNVLISNTKLQNEQLTMNTQNAKLKLFKCETVWYTINFLFFLIYTLPSTLHQKHNHSHSLVREREKYKKTTKIPRSPPCWDTYWETAWQSWKAELRVMEQQAGTWQQKNGWRKHADLWLGQVAVSEKTEEEEELAGEDSFMNLTATVSSMLPPKR